MHRCADDSTLRAYLAGKLTATEATAIESAIESCPACRQRCDDVERQLAEQWRGLRSAAAQAGGQTYARESHLADAIRRVSDPPGSADSASSAAAETVLAAQPEGTAAAQRQEPPDGCRRRLDGVSAEEFLQRLRRSRLAPEELLQRLASSAIAPGSQTGSEGRASAVETAVAAQTLVGLTDWQLEQLARGNTALLLDNGRYELRRPIGQGGMGAVYLARHRLMHRDVALKVIDPKKVSDPRLIARFKREVEASSRLQHEHIVQALDVGQHGEVSFLVLEYVAGSDLAAIVRRDGPLPVDQAAAICLQAASALAYAHAQGVVHRDIKPQNILLSTTGVTKILDMGLARIADAAGDDHTSLTQEGAVMGTVDYMAPEQARDTRTADARSDLYSLGATLYYLLAGQPPFAGGTTIDKLARLATEAPPPLGLKRLDCPLGLTQLVDRLLSKSPAERPASAQELVRALRPYAAERIAGRAVATASVQAAAEGQAFSGGGDALPAPSVVFENPSALSIMRRRKSAFSGKLWGGLAGLAALVMLAAIAVAPRGSTSPNDAAAVPSDPSATTASGPPPPAAYRADVSGHWGESYEYSWLRPGSLLIAPSDGDMTERFKGAFAWSPDDRALATAIGDADVRIWNTATGETSFVYRGHGARVLDVVWGPDNRTLASCDLEGSVHVWAVGSQQPLATHRAPFGYARFQMGLAFSPDGREIAIVENRPNLPRLFRWNWREDRVTAAWSVTGGLLCYSSTGRFLACWGKVYQVPQAPLTIVDESGGPPLPPLQTEHPQPRPVVFTPDDRLITLSTDQTRLAAWEPATGQQLAEYALPEGAIVWGVSRSGDRVLIRQGEELHHLQLAADGAEFQIAQTVPIKRTAWDNVRPCLSNSLTRAFTTNAILSVPEGRPIAKCTVVPVVHAPLGRLMAGRYLQAPRGVLDLETGDVWPPLPDGAVVLPDGRLRAIVGRRILEWPGVGRQNDPFRVVADLHDIEDQHGVRISDDGQFVYDWKDTASRHVRCRKVETGEIVSQREVSWFGDLASYCNDRDLEVYRIGVETDSPRLQVRRGGGARLDLQLPLPASCERASLAITASSDGRYVVILPSAWGGPYPVGQLQSAYLYDLDSPDRPPSELVSRQINNLDYLIAAFSPSSRYLYLTDEVWETATLQRVWTCPERPRARSTLYSPTQHVAALNDDRRLVIWQDNQIQIWDWPANRKLATLFWMPNDQWAFVNHSTGCWTGSELASQFLRVTSGSAQPAAEWMHPPQFEKRTGWKNNPAQAGLAHTTPPPATN